MHRTLQNTLIRRSRDREVQQAESHADGQDDRRVPRPLPDRRRQGALPLRRVAEGPWPPVLRRLEDGRDVHPVDHGEDMNTSWGAAVSAAQLVASRVCPHKVPFRLPRVPIAIESFCLLCPSRGYAKLTALSGIDALVGAIQRKPSGQGLWQRRSTGIRVGRVASCPLGNADAT